MVVKREIDDYVQKQTKEEVSMKEQIKQMREAEEQEDVQMSQIVKKSARTQGLRSQRDERRRYSQRAKELPVSPKQKLMQMFSKK